MSKIILLAVDTTSHTAAAAGLAGDLAAATGDHVVVLHVHEFAVGRFGRIQVDCNDDDGEMVARNIVERLIAAGATARAEIRKTPVGHISRTICETAEELDARMIILGSSTSHDVPRMPFGSVSLKLLHLCSKPVLLVPKGAVYEAAPDGGLPEVAAAGVTS